MDYLQYNLGLEVLRGKDLGEVLNLVINGLPSILKLLSITKKEFNLVLNLVINGLPSIHRRSNKG